MSKVVVDEVNEMMSMYDEAMAEPVSAARLIRARSDMRQMVVLDIALRRVRNYQGADPFILDARKRLRGYEKEVFALETRGDLVGAFRDSAVVESLIHACGLEVEVVVRDTSSGEVVHPPKPRGRRKV